MEFRERFERLDSARWTASYLPAWSSRAAAAATVDTGPDGLTLSIPPEQPLWCPDLHPTPLRVSAIHSANRSGPVGSTDAPQPFRPGLLVREEQPTVVGLAVRYGTVEVTCAARLDERSMFSAWLVGLEDRPERCGEICLVEVFGRSVHDGTAALGQGIHPFRDPGLVEDFEAPPTVLDVDVPHTYRISWQPDRVVFDVDGVVTRDCSQAPDYPMMLILGLFDFPDEGAQRRESTFTPSLRVSEVRASDLGPGTLVDR